MFQNGKILNVHICTINNHVHKKKVSNQTNFRSNQNQENSLKTYKTLKSRTRTVVKHTR